MFLETWECTNNLNHFCSSPDELVALVSPLVWHFQKSGLGLWVIWEASRFDFSWHTSLELDRAILRYDLTLFSLPGSKEGIVQICKG